MALDRQTSAGNRGKRVDARSDRAAPHASVRQYQLCTTCVMDTSDAGITFDEEGRCLHCTSYARLASSAGQVPATVRAQQFERAVAKIKAAGKGQKYDCVIGLSGGVDSSYVALKVRELGLKPLAVHLDNGWDSEIAVRNIERIVRSLGIDLYTWVLDWEEFRELQLSFVRGGTPDLEIPTDHAIIASVFKIAWRFRIPWLVMGHNIASELVLPANWAQGHYDWQYIKSVHSRFSHQRLRTFPHLHTLDYLRFRHSIARQTWNILNYLDYDRSRAVAELERKVRWRNYGGKHYESIYTRFIQGFILPVKFGIDKRRAHYSSMILAGLKSRDEALALLTTPMYASEELLEEDRIFVLKKLRLSEAEFDAVMAAPPREASEYASMLNSPAYRGARYVYRAARAALDTSAK